MSVLRILVLLAAAVHLPTYAKPLLLCHKAACAGNTARIANFSTGLWGHRR